MEVVGNQQGGSGEASPAGNAEGSNLAGEPLREELLTLQSPDEETGDEQHGDALQESTSTEAATQKKPSSLPNFDEVQSDSCPVQLPESNIGGDDNNDDRVHAQSLETKASPYFSPTGSKPHWPAIKSPPLATPQSHSFENLSQQFGGGKGNPQQEGNSANDLLAALAENGAILGDINPSELGNLMTTLLAAGNLGNMLGNTEVKTEANTAALSPNKSLREPLVPSSAALNDASNSLLESLNILNLLGFPGLGQVADSQGSEAQSHLKMEVPSLFNQLMGSLSNFEQPAAPDDLPAENGATSCAKALLSTPVTPFSHSSLVSPSKTDSYCEICKRNLCNRYFLKTHMLKKHGIVPATPTSADDSALRQAPSSQPQDGREQVAKYPRGPATTSADPAASGRSVIVSSANGVNRCPDIQATQSADSLISMANGVEKFWSDGSPYLCTSNGAQTGASEHSEVLENLLALRQYAARENEDSLPKSALPSPLKKAGMSQLNSAFPFILHSTQASMHQCEQCEKEFDSRLSLLQHQLLQHSCVGQPQPSSSFSPNDFLSRLQQPSAGGSESAASETMASKFMAGDPLLSPLGFQLPGFTMPSQISNLLGGGGGGTAFGSPSSASAARSAAAALMAKLSGSVSSVITSGASPNDFNAFGTLGVVVPDGSALDAAMSLPEALAAASGSEARGTITPVRKQYTSTSKNYCGVCKKYVCNKYFLRTHMLKMHNVVIDENKPVIGNIDTLEKEKSGSVIFRCDICLNDMATRGELRQHKRDAHGVMPLSSPGQRGSSPGQKQLKLDPGHERFSTSAERDSPDGENQPGTPIHRKVDVDAATVVAAAAAMGPLIGDSELKSPKPLSNMELVLNAIDECQASNQQRIAPTVTDANGPPSSSSAASSSGRMASNSVTSTGSSVHSATHMPEASSLLGSLSACRYCGEKFLDELKMHLHLMGVHSVEILSQAYAAEHGEAASVDESSLGPLFTHVALQMARANRQKIANGTNHPSDGGVQGGALLGEQALLKESPKQSSFRCPSCPRSYKSQTRLANHIKLVHHSFVARLSPSKPRPVVALSPGKLRKLRTWFKCMRCACRFATRVECTAHVLRHLQSEKEAPGSPPEKRSRLEGVAPNDEDEDNLKLLDVDGAEGKDDADRIEDAAMAVEQYIKVEEEEGDEEMVIHGGQKPCSYDAVRQVVSELHADRVGPASHQGTICDKADKQQGLQTHHSHTSGSASPLSAHSLPEAFAQVPIHSPKLGYLDSGSTSTSNISEHNRLYTVQSFVLKKVQTDAKDSEQILDEVVAHLPVRSNINEPTRVTFELVPTSAHKQDEEAQVQHF